MDKRQQDPIYVTKPYLPPLEEFIPYLEQIWESRCLTNNGPFHQQFEKELCGYLGVPYISLFSSGTLALITALQALRITGEVITTPFSFVATTHSLYWNGIQPVFVDIDPQTFNIDHRKIEAAITPRTTAIVPVHIYGNPCNITAIQGIADTYGLKVIYDAAQAFGVHFNGKSVLNYGDLSVLSFHATKICTTFEGGAIVCHNEKMKRHIDYLKNFGFVDEVTIIEPGINAKMSEFQAALGRLNLKHVGQALSRSAEIDNYYRKELDQVPGIIVPDRQAGCNQNFSFFPILVGAGFSLNRDALYQKFCDNGINVRRYFYPLISNLSMYHSLPSAAPANLPVAKSISEKVLCLPIYPDLTRDDQDRVIEIMTGK